MAILLREWLGFNLKVIPGYTDSGVLFLAMERGEIEGRCAWSWSTIKSTKLSWVTDKKIIMLIQLAVEKHPELPDVPLITEFATTEEQRELLDVVVSPSVMGRPLLAPPGLPPDRLAALRAAFNASMADAKFIADAEGQNLEISRVTGEQIEQMLTRLFALPKPVIDKAARSVEGSN
jgi:tripartite-type tricarboxylate transporter receptor subunit TctC